MSKKVVFTSISPLPPDVTREVVLEFLHNHEAMIDLNPLVKERHRITTPPHAQADEGHCVWYSLTDTISYLPGVNGAVSYTSAFNNLHNGIQTHCYAPAGVGEQAPTSFPPGLLLTGDPRPRQTSAASGPSTAHYQESRSSRSSWASARR